MLGWGRRALYEVSWISYVGGGGGGGVVWEFLSRVVVG